MATAASVSNFILSMLAPGRELETIKLQKLLYFCQGWSLALCRKPLFQEEFEAWRYGPVVREIYSEHARYVRIPQSFRFHESSSLRHDPNQDTELDAEEQRLVRSVVRDYGSLNTFRLVDITHLPGTPWSQVHQPEGEAQVIPKHLLEQFFLNEKNRVSMTGELIPA
ncbi:DUF4065 domain-containing protein [Corynebacterium belfantii]|uniref:Panacea domain-containing protein n=1 Tax=Corynebacterium belfantii TaxID=2014537 RepID=UPI0018D48524|nr:type II toxin-antitoxin system antitoxin SocA domain-containing protein [Corynebacterium belfantii]MBG9328499.1 DUF4065 domain-containing protein [Corynebacterium belfantii]